MHKIPRYYGVVVCFLVALLGIVLLPHIIEAASVGVSGIPRLLWAPTDFTVAKDGDDVVGSWTMGTNSDYTLVRRSSNGYPTTVTGGYEVYNGTGTTFVDTEANPDSNRYFYSAWGYNSTLVAYSPTYATARIGGNNMIYILLGLLVISLSGIFMWKRYMILGFGAAGAWALLGFHSLQESTSSNPSQITDTYMALFWFCIAFTIGFVLLPLVMRPKPEAEDIYPEELDEGDRELYDAQQAERKDRRRIDILFGRKRVKKPKLSTFAKTGKVTREEI